MIERPLQGKNAIVTTITSISTLKGYHDKNSLLDGSIYICYRLPCCKLNKYSLLHIKSIRERLIIK